MKVTNLHLTLTAVVAAAALTASAYGPNAFAQGGGEPAISVTMVPQTIKPGDADGAFITGSKFSEPDGDKMYRRVCAGCHMPDAKGAQGAGFYPALAGNPKLAAAGYPTYVVTHGMHGMPAVGAMMTDQQVADVVNHIRTHFGNKYKDKVTAADVKAAR